MVTNYLLNGMILKVWSHDLHFWGVCSPLIAWCTLAAKKKGQVRPFVLVTGPHPQGNSKKTNNNNNNNNNNNTWTTRISGFINVYYMMIPCVLLTSRGGWNDGVYNFCLMCKGDIHCKILIQSKLRRMSNLPLRHPEESKPITGFSCSCNEWCTSREADVRFSVFPRISYVFFCSLLIQTPNLSLWANGPCDVSETPARDFITPNIFVGQSRAMKV